MEKLGACGLACDECDAYKATQANDLAAIKKVIQEWNEAYNIDIKPENVWCDGCMSATDRKCGHCAECEIRACVAGRGLANCAGCDDYSCETLTKFFESCPSAKGRLDAVRAARP